MHSVCIICVMAYRAAVVGASGYTGAELLRLLAGHPEIEVVHVTADSNAGDRRRRPLPALAPAYGDAVLAPLDAADLRGLRPRVLRAAARREPGAAARRSSTTSRTSSTSAPTSGFRPTCTRAGTARRTRAPEIVGRFAYGLVELYRDDLATHAHVAAPGCYPTAVSLACAPLFALDLVEPHVDRRRGVGRVGRGPRAEDDEPVLGSERERLRVRPAHAPPHAPRWSRRCRRSRAGPSTCCSRRTSCRRRAASSPRVTRARPRPGLSTARLLEHYREFYADDPCVVVVDEPSGTKATYGANVVHVTRPLRRAHRHASSRSRPRTTS